MPCRNGQIKPMQKHTKVGRMNRGAQRWIGLRIRLLVTAEPLGRLAFFFFLSDKAEILAFCQIFCVPDAPDAECGHSGQRKGSFCCRKQALFSARYDITGRLSAKQELLQSCSSSIFHSRGSVWLLCRISRSAWRTRQPSRRRKRSRQLPSHRCRQSKRSERKPHRRASHRRWGCS